MTYQEMEQQAIQKRDQLASITESMGLQLTKLSRSLFPAFAIAFDKAESSICSTVPAEPNLVLFSSGVLHTIPIAPELYYAVNTANRELGFGRFMVGTNTEEPGVASVFYQLGAFAHHVTESDYLRFCLTFSAKQGVDGRETLGKEGISGRPYGWNSDDVDRLYLQHAV